MRPEPAQAQHASSMCLRTCIKNFLGKLFTNRIFTTSKCVALAFKVFGQAFFKKLVGFGTKSQGFNLL